VCPSADTVLLPLGDGGEGTMEALISSTEGEIINTEVTGPLGKKVKASYGVLGNNKTCVIEMAKSAGLDLLHENERNPLYTTTYGVGELIAKALDDGYKSFIISIGGSGTNDGGAGMLQALGINLLNKSNNNIDLGGKFLKDLIKIDSSNFDKRIKTSNFTIATDVTNPLVGINGASFVFGEQKGGGEKDLELLDLNLRHWAGLIYECTGVKLHNKSGAGAGGGITGAFQAFFPMKVKSGIDVILDYTQFNKHLYKANYVITGEGKVDRQTKFGKTPLGVSQFSIKKGIPTIVIAGALGEGFEFLNDYGVISVNSIINKPMSLAEAIKNTPKLLEETTIQIMRSVLNIY